MAKQLLPDALGSRRRCRGLLGDAGYALALDAAGNATRDATFFEAANWYLRHAAGLDDHPTIGLFTGISGLRSAAALFRRHQAGLDKLIANCDAYIESQLPCSGDLRVDGVRDFDIVNGWSGALLARAATGTIESERLTELLIWLIGDRGRWRCVNPLDPRASPRNDLGVAHGLSGVLAALAISIRELSPNAQALVHREVNALMTSAVWVNGVVNWPPAEGWAVGERSAWCYGAAGVAAAMYWVARRLCSPELECFALHSLKLQSRLSCDRWFHSDYALCHGTLGNALIFASVGTACGSDELLSAAAKALAHAVGGLEQDSGLCYGLNHLMEREALTDELNGAAGIVLALLTMIGETDSLWMRLHALEAL